MLEKVIGKVVDSYTLGQSICIYTFSCFKKLEEYFNLLMYSDNSHISCDRYTTPKYLGLQILNLVKLTTKIG